MFHIKSRKQDLEVQVPALFPVCCHFLLLRHQLKLSVLLQGNPGLPGRPGEKGDGGPAGRDGQPGLDGFPGPPVKKNPTKTT